MKRLAALFTLFALLLPNVAFAALTDNITGYWKFDQTSGNAADATGNGFTLTNNGSILFDNTTGKINNGASLNGTNQYFSSTAAGLQLTSDLTFATWVDPTSLPTSRSLLWNTFSNAGTSGFITGLEKVSGALYLRAALYNGSNHDYTYTSQAITLNTWTQVAFVYTAASGQVEFYINCTLVHTETGYPTSIPTKSTAYLGIDGNLSAGNFFIGYMDEPGLWSRPLSGSEICQLYNSGTGLQYPFSVASAAQSIIGLVRSFWLW